MNYITQHKTPEELLRALGFEKAPDRGWQIITSNNGINREKKKRFHFTPVVQLEGIKYVDTRSLIPKTRLHALFFENQLSIHWDAAARKNKHKADSRHSEVIKVMNRIKELDKPDERDVASQANR